MKYISLLLASCFAASASAATYNAQGKIINSKDAKNPGIVKFEKSKTVAAKKNNNKSISLAKTYTADQVTAVKASFNSNTNAYTLNGNTISIAQYKDFVDNFEKNDKPRKTYTRLNYTNPATPYASNNGSNCAINSYPTNDNFFNDREGALDAMEFMTQYSERNSTHKCNFAPYINACGAGVKMYNVVGDNKISLNNKSCKNSVLRDYSLGIQHYYAHQFLKAAAPRIAEISTVNEGNARTSHKFAQHPLNPYQNNIQIGNIISTSTKDVALYNEEAAELDDYIYHNRVIELAPYTENGKKTGAGISLNAISVGGVSNPESVPYREKFYTLGGSTPSPKFANKTGADYLKPDIYSFSYANNTTDDYERVILHGGNKVDFMGLNDSWGGATSAAAMVADLLSKYDFYKWHPEVVKALMLTAHSREPVVKTDYTTPYEFSFSNPSKFHSQLYKHVPSLREMLTNNISRYWYGNNNDFFTNEKITFTENVEGGKQYNIAIAWLVRGDYAMTERHLSSIYQIKIYNNQNGAQLATSEHLKTIATQRYLDLNIPTGVSKIKIEIIRTRNKGDRVIIGYNLHKITQN
ncbi:MAG: hypothetical protein SPL52_15160 [Fibrobacter sp.]|nr:hypothetical protein [Fibrobacter sp.]